MIHCLSKIPKSIQIFLQTQRSIANLIYITDRQWGGPVVANYTLALTADKTAQPSDLDFSADSRWSPRRFHFDSPYLDSRNKVHIVYVEIHIIHVDSI